MEGIRRYSLRFWLGLTQRPVCLWNHNKTKTFIVNGTFKRCTAHNLRLIAVGGYIVNEWGLASEITKWWESAFPSQADWKLRTATVEHQVPGGLQRSDILVCGDGPVLCGEIRLPDHAQSAPWNLDNLKDAANKANAHGCRWAFTSDSQTLLLIDTTKAGPLITRIVHRVDLERFSKRQDLDTPAVLARVRGGWLRALDDLGPIITGQRAPSGMAPDELFVNALRELLAAPVGAIRDAMHRRRSEFPEFETSLIEWLVDDQGLTHDPSKWDDEIVLAAKLSSYVFATRLLFYEALKRTKVELSALAVPEGSSSFVAARTLGAAFEQARAVSGDYETLFTWDTVAEYALLDDACVPHWRRIVDHIHVFDVTTIGHDILGRLFERLIDPHERYEWGQHYTTSDVVDLILSFALPDGTGDVLDPAVGGGTFLVRAYARKKSSEPNRSHQELLGELYGTDVSRFAATIATVNLAIQQLDFADNYPQIAARSFFRISPDTELMRLPVASAYGLGMREEAPIVIGQVQAVVGNPPYVRLHKLGEERQREARRVLGRSGATPVPSDLHKLSNLHVYFWLHGAQFLAPGGRIALLTAGEWMDADYGVALQRWLLDNFCIEAFIESGKEAWFSEARVGTVVTVARRCTDERQRDDNSVRFVRLRRTLRDFYDTVAGNEDHFAKVDRLRDELLGLSGTGESDKYDWSVVSQRDLRTLGTAR